MPRGKTGFNTSVKLTGAAKKTAATKAGGKKSGVTRPVDPVKNATNILTETLKLYIYAAYDTNDIYFEGNEFYENYTKASNDPTRLKLNSPFSIPTTVKTLLYQIFDEYCGVIASAGENTTIQRNLGTITSFIFNCAPLTAGTTLANCDDPKFSLDAVYTGRVTGANISLRNEGIQALKRFLKHIAHTVSSAHYYKCGTMQNIVFHALIQAGLSSEIVDGLYAKIVLANAAPTTAAAPAAPAAAPAAAAPAAPAPAAAPAAAAPAAPAPAAVSDETDDAEDAEEEEYDEEDEDAQ